MPKPAAHALTWCRETQSYTVRDPDHAHTLLAVFGNTLTVCPESQEWFAWLERAPSFAFEGREGRFTARRETKQRGERYWIAYQRCGGKLAKGAKTDDKLLEVETTRALDEYLRYLYGPDWYQQKERPVWVSFSNNESRGERPSIQAVEQIDAKHIGTSKSHVTRHTTALALDELGVPLSEIQELLDHDNTATTGLYTKRLKKSQNRHGRALEQVFGVSATQPEEERA